nr:ISAs1 family transposase [Burkholderia sp. BCC1993]
MDFLFVDATHDAHAKIPALISQWNTVGALESEVKLRFSAKLQSSRSGLIGKSSIVMIEATRESGDTKTTERRYYVSSLPPNAARIAQAVRAHWRIENSMHWVLDMAFGEDQCRVRVNNAAQNFAILRRICLNLLKADTTTKAGIKNRRLKAGASDGYRAAVLRL